MRRGAPPSRAAAPPLWLWAGVAALVLGVLVTSLPDYFDSEVTELELTRSARRERLLAFAREVAAEPRDLTVIALGDSALRHATRLDDDMEAYWQATAGLDAQFLRISHNGATLGTFLDIFDEILAMRPDVLVLQAGLLRRKLKTSWQDEHGSFQAGEPSTPGYGRRERIHRILRRNDPFRHQQFFARRYLGHLGIGRFADEDWAQRMARRELRDGCDPGDRSRNLERYIQKYPADFDHRILPMVAASASTLIERAAAAGTVVVVAEIPRGEPMDRLASVQTRRASLREFTAEPGHRDSVRHWWLDRSPPPEHYCDWVHMSEAGRDAWSLWLGEQLAGLPSAGARR